METWKQVVEFEGLYEVSDKGNVRSVSRLIHRKDGKIQQKRGRLLKSSVNNKGYAYVMMNDRNYKQRSKTIHRLVAQAFLPNPSNFPIVNHKDENKLNNCVDNLEWCSYSYNTTYNGNSKRISAKLKGKPAKNAVKVIELNSGIIYNSIDAFNKVHKIRYCDIQNMLNGTLDEVKGYRLRKL